ncbi:hypothetical protein N7541_000917 [Penicillium brevicompactum]|uniref:Uncharacterized protein n=1 Tax=Penicillium brevicompactum TaxID=5074 RepID=A0A9W9RV79_PENBR|nr:hypothetical protein N7541_000917 [Penicillium brevicompactum]
MALYKVELAKARDQLATVETVAKYLDAGNKIAEFVLKWMNLQTTWTLSNAGFAIFQGATRPA